MLSGVLTLNRVLTANTNNDQYDGCWSRKLALAVVWAPTAATVSGCYWWRRLFSVHCCRTNQPQSAPAPAPGIVQSICINWTSGGRRPHAPNWPTQDTANTKDKLVDLDLGKRLHWAVGAVASSLAVIYDYPRSLLESLARKWRLSIGIQSAAS